MLRISGELHYEMNLPRDYSCQMESKEEVVEEESKTCKYYVKYIVEEV